MAGEIRKEEEMIELGGNIICFYIFVIKNILKKKRSKFKINCKLRISHNLKRIGEAVKIK